MGEKFRHYVYELRSSEDNEIFYVGKGSGDRKDTHRRDAINGKHYNIYLQNKIKKILRNGFHIITEKVFESHDYKEAYAKEVELVALYGRRNIGTGPLVNLTPGGEGVKYDFLLFEEAREYVRKLNFKTWEEWKNYCKSGLKPDNIPHSLGAVYKDKWLSIQDFLGTKIGFSGFLPFEEAREYVRQLNLSGQKEWYKYCKSGNKPDNIPSTPSSFYEKHGWTSLSDWLNTKNISPSILKEEFLPFEEAREFTLNLKIKGRKEWYKYCKSGNKPSNIPSNPHRTYESSGWIGLDNFLGYKKDKRYTTIFLSFNDAKIFVANLKFNGQKEWKKYCKSGNKPDNIPANPHTVYEDEWISFGDWLGTKNVANKFKINNVLSYNDAKKFLKQFNLKSFREYKIWFYKNKPSNLPLSVALVYKNDFISMSDFLGSNNVSRRNLIFTSFIEAKNFAQTLNLKTRKEWQNYWKTHKIPDNIPICVNETYKKEWISWENFLKIQI